MQQWALQTLFNRGMLEDAIVREELLKDIDSGKTLTIYQGFDPTSPNLHIGHLLGLRVLRWFQLHGHRVILLIGDFTGRIGDPSDRPEARKRLTHQQVLDNATTYREQFSRIFDLDGENPAEVRMNGDWLDQITLAQFSDIMDKFTVQQLLERSMFQERLDKNEALYLNEMIYPVLQAYDSVAMEVDAELGASDQLFNMMRGRDLVRSYLGKPKHVLTTPLLPGLDGRKMSKTYGNTVDLTEKPVSMFFKLTLVNDSALPSFMRVLTDSTEDEIQAVEELMTSEKNLVGERVAFAHKIVSLLHSADSANDAREEFQRVISEGELPSNIPTLTVPNDSISAEGVNLVNMIATSDLVESKSDVRRIIQQGGVSINGSVVEDPRAHVELTSLSGALLKIGKRGYLRITSTEQ